MVNIDFSLAIALYGLLIILALLMPWLLAKRQILKGRDLSLDQRFIWHCSVCTYTYINTKEDVISVCPRCSSFNKKNS